jgi:hypothetical protein
MRQYNLPFTKEFITDFCKENQISYLGLFGSYARGEQSSTSDIDLIARFSGKISLFTLVRLERELQKQTDMKVDLLTDNSISKYIRASVTKDLVTLYEKN